MRSLVRRAATLGVLLTLLAGLSPATVAPGTARAAGPVPPLYPSALVASTDSPSAAVLAAPITGPADDIAVLVEPRSFAGGGPEDSVCLGRAGSARDFVLGWYNHHRGTSGVDVRVDGTGQGNGATGGCCTTVRWTEGDRFAVVFSGGTMTSWAEHDGRWRRLRTAPFGTVVAPERAATWTPAVGLRLTSGELGLDRLTVPGGPD
ncbi:hypothetical protein ABZ863_09705 [Saccharomonospora sp. NPDC046836]|uniref:hypothetical protein n=1 Tax=Saccharomonospora sp. NPDC046836 TaxID=3156921 RepID=UPI0033D82534